MVGEKKKEKKISQIIIIFQSKKNWFPHANILICKTKYLNLLLHLVHDHGIKFPDTAEVKLTLI